MLNIYIKHENIVYLKKFEKLLNNFTIYFSEIKTLGKIDINIYIYIYI